jgi:hypothetical protein
MKQHLTLYVIGWGILILIIGSILIIYHTNWYTFLGIFLLLWANNIGLKINEIQKQDHISN